MITRRTETFVPFGIYEVGIMRSLLTANTHWNQINPSRYNAILRSIALLCRYILPRSIDQLIICVTAKIENMEREIGNFLKHIKC